VSTQSSGAAATGETALQTVVVLETGRKKRVCSGFDKIINLYLTFIADWRTRTKNNLCL
jgi:hypothetical protein